MPSFAFAQTVSTPPTGVAKGAARTEARITSLKAKGDALIQQRLTSLNNMLTRLNNIKRLSAAEKATLTTNINSDINGLTTLKTKIDADTDLPILETDVKSIFTTYRVYAEFDPQTSMFAAADSLTTATDRLTQLAAKLQARITQAGSNGNNVSTLNNLLADMQNKLADAKNQYTSVQNNISGLTPSSYNSNPTGVHATFTNSRTLLKTARTDLQGAMQDAKQIVAGLKAFKTSVTTTPSTTSATVTP